MKTRTLTIIILFMSAKLMSSNLKISKPILYTDSGESYTVFNLSWDNAWHNQRNHDAIWIFFKFLKGADGYNQVKVDGSNHSVIKSHSDKNVKLGFEVPSDRLGLYIYPNENYRGHLNITLKIMLDNFSFKDVNTRVSDFTAYGIEMVKIPDGSFLVGDSDSSTVKFGSLYKSDEKGTHDGLFLISEERQIITVAPTRGNLYYQAPEGYEGDQTGLIPEKFPKGVDSFYIMKYEPTQGQYVAFLNSLSENQSQNRTNFGGKNYYEQRGSISIQNNEYYSKQPNAPCNYMSWDDSMAFADWACLRPMTEFEFTKASRGVEKQVINSDFPWGTNIKDRIQRVVADDGNLIMLNNWDESMLSDVTKEVFAASYYWVMDMAGSQWEKVITIGHPIGRKFIGTHGDGNLTAYGFATNEDWPKGIESTGGYGFRGGGFYGYGRDYHDFNPYSPISYRPYGGWSGGNRTKSYGARFVRTAK